MGLTKSLDSVSYLMQRPALGMWKCQYVGTLACFFFGLVHDTAMKRSALGPHSERMSLWIKVGEAEDIHSRNPHKNNEVVVLVPLLITCHLFMFTLRRTLACEPLRRDDTLLFDLTG